MHEYANWYGPMRNRRQGFLEELHLRVFTHFNDYHHSNTARLNRDMDHVPIKAGCFGVWSLHAVFLSNIYDGSFVAETGMKYAKNFVVQSRVNLSLEQKCFSAHVLCAQLLHVLLMQRSFET